MFKQNNKYTCINRYKDSNGKLVGYEIVNLATTNSIRISSEKLKELMTKRKITVDNLTLTIDNRLLVHTNIHNCDLNPIEIEIDDANNNYSKLKQLTDKYTQKSILLYGICPFDFEISNDKIYITHYNKISALDDGTLIIPNFVYGFRAIENKKIFDGVINFNKIISCKNINGSLNKLFSSCICDELDLSEFDVSNVDDMSHMFYGFYTANLNLDNWDTSKVTDMTGMFESFRLSMTAMGSNIVSAFSQNSGNPGPFIVNQVTNMSSMFQNCTTLKNISLPKQITSVPNTFNNAQQSASNKINPNYTGILNLRDFNTENVLNMSAMFKDCEANKIIIDKFRTDRVANMSQMFFRCKTNYINLINFNTHNVVDMSAMFSRFEYNNLNITSFNTENVKNMNSMFMGCTISKLDLSNFSLNSVKTLKELFSFADIVSLNISNFIINRNVDTHDIMASFNCKDVIFIRDKHTFKLLSAKQIKETGRASKGETKKPEYILKLT